MAEIEVHSDAYDAVRAALTEAASQLAAARGTLTSAVPSNAFGPIGAFIPPVLNAVGGAVEGAATFAGSVSQRTGDGIQKAVADFQTVDENGRADLDRIAVEG
ncbi:hypothetical protein CW368_05535 [Actinomycetales bacterium SN12]|nr:hypothetical protein CW368_05535 [Actinomycetales bacterium SN12]